MEAPIFSPTDIAAAFIECVDKSAVVNLRRFLARHARVQQWIVAADFSLGKTRPFGCFAFTIIPYDAWPWEIEHDAIAALTKDLKDSKWVPKDAIPWLRDGRRFHLAVTVRPTRAVFVGGAGSRLVQARDFAAKAVEVAKANPEGQRRNAKTPSTAQTGNPSLMALTSD